MSGLGMTAAAPELTAILETEPPGQALDLACGQGRHSLWLAERGWQVTAVDREPGELPGIHRIQIDLETHPRPIEPGAWDLIVCWLYWQPSLLPQIAAGLRPGGIAALAGKASGRFATSLAACRAAFPGWTELASGDNGNVVFFIARCFSP
jgi:SAM-dependent methyltransferase